MSQRQREHSRLRWALLTIDCNVQTISLLAARFSSVYQPLLAPDGLSMFTLSYLTCKPFFTGAEALTQALPHCKKLVVLEMLCCGLGDEGARSLAKNLPSCVVVFFVLCKFV